MKTHQKKESLPTMKPAMIQRRHIRFLANVTIAMGGVALIAACASDAGLADGAETVEATSQGVSAGCTAAEVGLGILEALIDAVPGGARLGSKFLAAGREAALGASGTTKSACSNPDDAKPPVTLAQLEAVAKQTVQQIITSNNNIKLDSINGDLGAAYWHWQNAENARKNNAVGIVTEYEMARNLALHVLEEYINIGTNLDPAKTETQYVKMSQESAVGAISVALNIWADAAVMAWTNTPRTAGADAGSSLPAQGSEEDAEAYRCSLIQPKAANVYDLVFNQLYNDWMNKSSKLNWTTGASAELDLQVVAPDGTRWGMNLAPGTNYPTQLPGSTTTYDIDHNDVANGCSLKPFADAHPGCVYSIGLKALVGKSGNRSFEWLGGPFKGSLENPSTDPDPTICTGSGGNFYALRSSLVDKFGFNGTIDFDVVNCDVLKTIQQTWARIQWYHFFGASIAPGLIGDDVSTYVKVDGTALDSSGKPTGAKAAMQAWALPCSN